MIMLGRIKVLAAGAGLIAAINAFALGGAWYNRQGEPDSVLVLTERELSRIGGRAASENSGMALRLRWEMLANEEQRSVFSAAQMQQAGFDSREHNCKRRLEHRVLVALELDGSAYRTELARRRKALETETQAAAKAPGDPRQVNAVERAQRELERTLHGSRLFVMDIDEDYDALRQRWPDRRRHLIVPGRVRPSHDCTEQTGVLTDILVDQINVPHSLHQALAALPSGYTRPSTAAADQYRLEIAFGQRLEPWLRKVERLDAPR